ncbi:solute carrier organic anion transporter family member [Elysia marginata]|uniref:Solute carrier organic anion transporter family member n=1 Tax=Elysia marginata TaxID=1093978 RepID=A0AAV4FT63_9GAST|nr:solute carrier organic anion transporter family member [Elysia marginata]
MNENGFAGHELESMLPQPLPLPVSQGTGHAPSAPPTALAPPNRQQQHQEQEENASLLMVRPTYSDLESPGDVSLGQTSVLSGQSEQSQHSRARLVKSPSMEKQPLGEHEVTVEGIVEDLDEASNRCGIGCWSPPCFQRCANVKVFVAFTCVLGVVSSALTTGYLNSVITTIEKRFEIGSSTSGVVAAAYEFGNLVAVIFVSYLGASRHIPKWIGMGVVVMGVGSLLFALPHIIAPKYSVRSGMVPKDRGDHHHKLPSEPFNISNLLSNSSSATPLAAYSSKTTSSLDEENICRAPQGKGQAGQSGEVCIDENSAGNWGYVLILLAAQILIGAGSTPIMTLGITYVDNHVSKDKSPSYLACIHASSALGPVMGYALGALLLQYYVDTFFHEVPISPSSPRWVGAWWGGFIICGLLLLPLAPIFFAYPRVLVADRRRVLDAKVKDAEAAPPGGGTDDSAMGGAGDGGQAAGYGRSFKGEE